MKDGFNSATWADEVTSRLVETRSNSPKKGKKLQYTSQKYLHLLGIYLVPFGYFCD